MDDKHTCKVGEPKCPVPAVDRGKCVIVGLNESLQVSDQIILSVIFKFDLQDKAEGSFYRGDVRVSITDHTFQTSSPLRHSSELKKFLDSIGESKEIVFIHRWRTRSSDYILFS